MMRLVVCAWAHRMKARIGRHKSRPDQGAVKSRSRRRVESASRALRLSARGSIGKEDMLLMAIAQSRTGPASRVEGHACSWLIGMSRPSLRWPRLAGASSNRPALRRAARRLRSIGGTITHSPACCRRAVECVPSLGVDGVVNSSEPCFVWGTVEHLRGCR
jgi:hypothetical protein